MRFWIGVTAALLAPLIALLCLPWMWGEGATAYGKFALAVIALAVVTDWDIRRRKAKAGYGVERAVDTATAAQPDLLMAAGWRGRAGFLASRSALQAGGSIATDLAGIGTAMALLLMIALFLLWLGTTPLVSHSGSNALAAVPAAGSSAITTPRGIAVDAAGNLYVTDDLNGRIEKLTPSGRLLATWGRVGVRPGRFLGPRGIAVDRQGRVYVADSLNNRIQVFSPAGRVLAVWTSLGKNLGTFDTPTGVAVDPRGRVYVADTGSSRIDELSSTGTLVRTFGSEGDRPGDFLYPLGVAVDRTGNLYVADSGNDRIQVISPAGRVLMVWGGERSTQMGQFSLPVNIALDTAGNVYVVDYDNQRIQKFRPHGRFVASWGTYGHRLGSFDGPHAVVADRDGAIYIADTWNHRVIKLSPTGQPLAAYLTPRVVDIQGTPSARTHRGPPVVDWLHTFFHGG